MTPGEKIRELRKTAGLTQAQAAEKAGCTQARLSMIERGEVDPQLTTLQRICEVLDAEVRVVRRCLPRKPKAGR